MKTTIVLFLFALTAFGATQMSIHRREFAVQTLSSQSAASTNLWTAVSTTLFPNGTSGTVGGWVGSSSTIYPNGATATTDGWVSSASTVYPQ